jgi:hypothetical protein
MQTQAAKNGPKCATGRARPQHRCRPSVPTSVCSGPRFRRHWDRDSGPMRERIFRKHLAAKSGETWRTYRSFHCRALSGSPLRLSGRPIRLVGDFHSLLDEAILCRKMLEMGRPPPRPAGEPCAGQTGDLGSRKPGEIVLPWAVMRRSWLAAERELVAASGAGWFAVGSGDTGQR